MSTAWILTFEVNEYDQYGEYFLAAFKEKPTKLQLKEAIDDMNFASDDALEHVLQGGGQRDNKNYKPFKGTRQYDNRWYNLREEKLK